MVKVPVVRELAWLAVLPLLAILAAFVAIAAALRGRYDGRALLFGAGAYLMLSVTLRHTLSRQHRRGVRLMQTRRFEEALSHFHASVRYFDQHPMVDKLRAITLLSAARMSYREMGLCNIAFGLSQLGRGADAKAAYQRVLREYPNNSLANAALTMIVSAEEAAVPRERAG
jgi:tetratricopeptide (TPR) repeat protein